jgi:hypothetical protein
MSEEVSTLEEYAKKVLIDLMTKKVMSERRMFAGVQASSTGGVQDFPSTARRAGTSKTMTEERMKHRDDIVNAKLIPNILPAYLPPLRGAINRHSVPRDFDYALVMAYLPKGIRPVSSHQDKLAELKFSDFNLGDKKAYSMLSLHKYVTRTKGKNLKILP